MSGELGTLVDCLLSAATDHSQRCLVGCILMGSAIFSMSLLQVETDQQIEHLFCSSMLGRPLFAW